MRWSLPICAVFVFMCAGSAPARADFMKSTSLNWIAGTKDNGTAGVTVIPSGPSAGLIIYASKDQIPAQGFHPDKLQSDRSSSVFLRYDPERRAFTALSTPYGKEYAIEGNLSLRLGEFVRISVSTENGAAPYISIVHESEPRSVLALLGLQVVINGTGARLESYLDAGTRNAAEVFDVRGSELFLQGVRFSEPKVGLPNQATQTHACLTRDVVLTPRGHYLEIVKGNVPQDVQQQVRSLQHGSDPQILQKFTVLNVSPTVVLALDGYGKTVAFMQERERISDYLICSINDLEFS